MEDAAYRLKRTNLLVNLFSLLCLPRRNYPKATEMTAPLGRIVICTKNIEQMAEYYSKHFGFQSPGLKATASSN